MEPRKGFDLLSTEKTDFVAFFVELFCLNSVIPFIFLSLWCASFNRLSLELIASLHAPGVLVVTAEPSAENRIGTAVIRTGFHLPNVI